jgi:hypothetical protein
VLAHRTTVVIGLYCVRCPDSSIKTEKVPQLPGKRFEEVVGLGCEGAAVRAGGAAVWAGGEHGASHCSALSEALGEGQKKTGLTADGH